MTTLAYIILAVLIAPAYLLLLNLLIATINYIQVKTKKL